jgi:ribosomal protein L3
VLRVDTERNLLLVNGGVPGATGSVVLVRGSVKQKAGRK